MPPTRGDLTGIDRIAADVVRLLQQRMQPASSPKLARPRTMNFMLDGGGSAITTGIKGWLGVDDAFTITGVELLADQLGSLALDIARASYANFPTFVSLIGTGTQPSFATAQSYQDNLLNGWTSTQLSPDDLLQFNVTAAATCKLVLVKIRLRPGS